MIRVKISRLINYHLLRGKRGQMVSTRVYVEERTQAVIIIDWVFFVLRGEEGHCEKASRYDGALEAPRPQTRAHETHPPSLENLLQGGDPT